jgi:hypothetical protein
MGKQNVASHDIDPRPLVAARVAITSVGAVARVLGMPRESIARLAGGLPVRPGTLALARERVERLTLTKEGEARPRVVGRSPS